MPTNLEWQILDNAFRKMDRSQLYYFLVLDEVLDGEFLINDIRRTTGTRDSLLFHDARGKRRTVMAAIDTKYPHHTQKGQVKYK